jgi:hypothetical protein
MVFKYFTAAVAILFGVYQIWVGFRGHRSSGFIFHILGGFLTGLPFLAIGVILLMGQGRRLGGWEILLLLVWLGGIVWRGWKVQEARNSPEPDRRSDRDKDSDSVASQDTIVKEK